MIVVYASKWAVSASLLQEYDGVYWSVSFVSRTLNPNDINYGMVEKEVLALLSPGCVIRYAGVPRDQSPHSIFNPRLVGPIFGSQWEAGEMGRVVVELDFEG